MCGGCDERPDRPGSNGKRVHIGAASQPPQDQLLDERASSSPMTSLTNGSTSAARRGTGEDGGSSG